MAWRETLCNILDATDKNLRFTSVGPSTHPSAILQKVTEQTYKTDANVARAEFSSLVNTVQSSLAELRLEVSAAQQISNHAASQLPHLSKNLVASHTSQVASVEGSLNISTTEVAQLKANLTELAATAQQTQARMTMLSQQQSEAPARSDMAQLQDSMRSVEASLQHLQTAQTAADSRWQITEAAVARLETADGLEQRMSQQMHQLDSAVTGRLDAETQEALRKLNEHTGPLSSHTTGLRGASETGSRDSGNRVEDRLTSLEADLSHSTAATDAMSSIIDQVAQLGEQQVQGCMTRITHLETDLVHREETQQLRVELAACLKTEAVNGAAVAQHATHLSSVEKRLRELHAEMQSSAAQAHPSSSTDAAGQSGSQSEVEELNERLFELRVELQNLADDTTISVASIKRKAELAEQHAEEASEAAASCKQALEAAHAAAPEAAMALSAGWHEVQQQVHGLQTQVDASKETQAELQVLKQQLDSLQGVTAELTAHLTKLAEKHASASEEGQTGQAALQQRLRKIELTVADALVEVASQMKALEARESMVTASTSELLRAAPHRPAAAPHASPSGGIADSRMPVPDLMTFSPAAGIRPPGLNHQPSGAYSGMAPLPTVPAGSSKAAQSVSSVQQSMKPGAQHSTEHSPGVSLNTHFQLSGSSLLDESDNGSADEEEVGHQLTVIQQQLARDDIDEWERDILMSEWDLLNKVKHNETPKS
ncbi:hypothetical protein WJX82_008654 [Trebouxia sp. C0006]